jgi:tetratricopeptide (TPR) repeat protein
MHRMTWLVASMLFGGCVVSIAQEASPPVRLYEAGQYDAAASQVSARADAGEASPEDLFWAGQSLVRLSRDGEAAGLFRRLGGEDDNDPWRAVGRSAAALAEGQREVALQQAVRAVELGPELFYAQYQHGLARMDAQQWQPAADAFERATQIDDGAAYAHYYAGMAYNRLKRIDRMATHLNRFIELAPNAPEREQVQNVLRMLKGMR